ncbi:DUF6985 domain-containing protein [Stenomitos frigidus]
MMTLHDSDFGPMHFDGSHWRLERRVRFNGVDIPVQIEPEDADTRTLSSVQREAVQLALTLPPDVLVLAAPAVVQNYEVYRDLIGDEAMPLLSASIDVWQAVQPSYIEVPPHGEITTPTFLLFAECDWDVEHGLVVRFRNGHADASSQQGELGLEG